MDITSRFIPHINRAMKFTPRGPMKVGAPTRAYSLAGHKTPAPPAADWAKNLAFPILGNDQYGDCMYAAAAHGDQTLSGNEGAEDNFSAEEVVKAYLRAAGGDNGMDEGMIVAEWERGLCGYSDRAVFDVLDIDPNNAEVMKDAIYHFGVVQFMLAVPDKWINQFSTGAVWDAPATADERNGHGVLMNGYDGDGRYKTQTWGSYVWITPAGVGVCDASAFVVASKRWFDPAGYAPNGHHYDELSQLWVQRGGKPWPTGVFPPPGPGPGPGPGPNPTPPGPTPSGPVYQFSGHLAGLLPITGAATPGGQKAEAAGSWVEWIQFVAESAALFALVRAGTVGLVAALAWERAALAAVVAGQPLPPLPLAGK